jgi:hypothetical protein
MLGSLCRQMLRSGLLFENLDSPWKGIDGKGKWRKKEHQKRLVQLIAES